MIPIEISIDRPGASAMRLTPFQESLRFSTAAVGGFAACSFDLPGDVARWKREIPHGSIVRLVLDTFVIWEGQVEDDTLRPAEQNGPSTSVTCFGLKRKLEETSVRRLWSKRDLDIHETVLPQGTVLGGITRNLNVPIATGAFNIADLTQVGVQGSGSNVAIPTVQGNWAEWLVPNGLTIIRWMGTFTLTGGNTGAGKMVGFKYEYAGGWSGGATYTASQALDVAAISNAVAFLVGFYNAGLGAITPAPADVAQFTNLRVLGTSLTEDASGGFYGGTILRDLIALVPGLTPGMIDAGSDFTIQAIERSVREQALSVVQEVAGYYTREWAVWEGGVFDWQAVNRDEPQWLCRVADLQPGTEITTSVDGLARTLYVLYADAADQRDKEASDTSTDQRNPYVKQGRTKDVLLSPGFPMTTLTAGQLASRVIDDIGGYVPVQGRIVLPAMIEVGRANGPSLPAFQIRGGENILVSDLPKTELFTQGRDGETLFHIVSTDADLSSGLVTLEVEGQTRRSDVLLARLAAVTRVFTG